MDSNIYSYDKTILDSKVCVETFNKDIKVLEVELFELF